MKQKSVTEHLKELTGFWFDEVREDTVPADIVKLVKDAGIFFVKELSIEHDINIRWFNASPLKERKELEAAGALKDFTDEGIITRNEKNIGGKCVNNETIWIRKGMTFDDTICILAHEMVHATQFCGSTEEQEAEAYPRGKQLALKYKPTLKSIFI